jgi:hypothetical protein
MLALGDHTFSRSRDAGCTVTFIIVNTVLHGLWHFSEKIKTLSDGETMKEFLEAAANAVFPNKSNTAFLILPVIY